MLRLANATLARLGTSTRITAKDVDIIVASDRPYGVVSEPILEAIRLFARTEGLIADPVYEGRTLRGLIDLIADGRLHRGHRVLILHMGGEPAVHGYADQLRQHSPAPLPFTTKHPEPTRGPRRKGGAAPDAAVGDDHRNEHEW